MTLTIAKFKNRQIWVFIDKLTKTLRLQDFKMRSQRKRCLTIYLFFWETKAMGAENVLFPWHIKLIERFYHGQNSVTDEAIVKLGSKFCYQYYLQQNMACLFSKVRWLPIIGSQRLNTQVTSCPLIQGCIGDNFILVAGCFVCGGPGVRHYQIPNLYLHFEPRKITSMSKSLKFTQRLQTHWRV